jgi:hypothetical protein
MTAAATEISWTEANQACLVAEFSRLKRNLGSSTEERGEEPLLPPVLSAIDRLCQLFGLSVFERDVLLLCAGVEMDSKLAALCGEAQGYPQRAYATFGLALAALREPHWSALTPDRPLRRFRLVEVDKGHGLSTAPLRIDERILHYLAGLNALDARLKALIEASPFPE